MINFKNKDIAKKVISLVCVLGCLLGSISLSSCSMFSKDKKFTAEYFDFFDTYSAITIYTHKESEFERYKEIAEELDMCRQDIVFALDAIQEPISLFEPIYHDGGDPIFVMDQISDDKNLDKNWLESVMLREAMKHLSAREQHILNLRFFEGKTQMEVAEEIGISQAQVSRLEKAAISHMKKYV